MNKKHCKEALDIYKKFLVRMDKVAEFLKVAEVRFIITILKGQDSLCKFSTIFYKTDKFVTACLKTPSKK